LYISISIQCRYYIKVAEKLVKGGLNLQDLLYLTIFIYIIYLLTILLRFKLPRLKSIYLLWEHHTKSIAKSSYSLLWGREFSLQMSLPRDIPEEEFSLLLVAVLRRRFWVRYRVLKQNCTEWYAVLVKGKGSSILVIKVPTLEVPRYL
jgi:hypothetical protein